MKIIILIFSFVIFIFQNYSYSNTSSFHEPVKKYQIASNHKFKFENKKFKKNENKSKFDPSEIISNCENCKKIDGFIEPNLIDLEIYKMAGLLKPSKEDVKIQKKRGMIETGLKPDFYNNKQCGFCDDCWAIDYTHKREFPALHKGTDLPKKFNEPILAMADGTVVGIFQNEFSRKGIEIVLRHRPEQSGLPYYTYTQYTHLNKMPDLQIGESVKLGQQIGLNGNSGKAGIKNKSRRPALHLAVMYSKSPEWSQFQRGFLVKDGYWMDPLAFLRNEAPYESKEVKKLKSKKVKVGYKKTNGEIVPAGSIKIWPFMCD